MDFTVKTAEFARVLTRVHQAVEKKTTIPILSSILLRLQGNSLRCQATDLEVAVSDQVEVSPAKDGAVCLPGDKLAEIVRNLPESNDMRVVLSANQSVQITCGKSRFRLAGLAPESFPELPEFGDQLAAIDGKILVQDLERSRFAVSTEESRFTLNAVLLCIADGAMITAATDAHRMCYSRRDFTPGVKFKGLIPLKAVNLLCRIMDHAFVNVGEDDNHFYFQQGNVLIITRKAVGNFPDYSRVLPNHENSLKVPRKMFMESIQRAMTCAQANKDTTAAVRLQFGSEAMTLFGSDLTQNESQDQIELAYDGAPFDIGLAARYLLEPLGVLEVEQVSLHFKDGKTAMELRPDPEDGYRYVVMPMRI